MSQWRVAIGQKQYGPYSLEKLREIYKEGRVPADALIWHPKLQKWIVAGELPELNTSRSAGEDAAIMMESPAPPDTGRRASKPPGGGEGTLLDFLAFRRMITPVIIQIIFWIGAVAASLSGIGMVIAGFQVQEMRGVLIGLFTMLLGPVVVRIYCELLIIFFRMNETLTEIRNDLKRSA